MWVDSLGQLAILISMIYNMATGLHPLSALYMGLIVSSLWQLLFSIWHVKIRQQSLRRYYLRFFAYFWAALALLGILLLLAAFFLSALDLFFGFQEILGNWGSLAFAPFVLWYYALTIKDIHITLTKTV